MTEVERAAVLAVLEKWRATLLAAEPDPSSPYELWLQLAEALWSAGAKREEH